MPYGILAALDLSDVLRVVQHWQAIYCNNVTDEAAPGFSKGMQARARDAAAQARQNATNLTMSMS